MIDNKDINQTELLTQPKEEKDKEEIIKEENIKEEQNELDNKLEENSNGNNGRWGKSEHMRFLAGCLLYKNNWKKVETYVRTRTSTQIRSHAQKYLKKLEKKYFSKGLDNKSPNDSFNDDLIDNILINKEKNEKNNLANNPKEYDDIKEKKEKENLIQNEEIDNIDKITTMKLKEEIDEDNKMKLTEGRIKQLVEGLSKENCDVEIVEKIIINIFRPNKKCEDISKPEPKKQNKNVNNTHVKSSKNIFLCQKQKREVNHEFLIRELLETNNPNDLQKLLKIYKQKHSPEINILLMLLDENN